MNSQNFKISFFVNFINNHKKESQQQMNRLKRFY